MDIIIDEWILIALILFPFLTGFFTAIKIYKIRLALFLLKRLSPKEFEKLLDDYNENKNIGTIDN